jgi:NDP-sugar pyrophosphorylase family protein
MFDHAFGAVLLAAGKASRLRSVGERTPKPLIHFAGQPFLSYLLAKLLKEGCNEIVVVVGHQAEAIERYISTVNFGEIIVTVAKQRGCGTGAALLSGVSRLTLDQPFFSINCDTILDVHLPLVVEQHIRKDAGVTAVVTALPGVPNWGAVSMDVDSRIIRFDENGSWAGSPQRISLTDTRRSNCGYYCFSGIHQRPSREHVYARYSIELDLMPAMVRRERAFAFDNGRRMFHDFGTIDRLVEARGMTDRILRIYPERIGRKI